MVWFGLVRYENCPNYKQNCYMRFDKTTNHSLCGKFENILFYFKILIRESERFNGNNLKYHIAYRFHW